MTPLRHLDLPPVWLLLMLGLTAASRGLVPFDLPGWLSLAGWGLVLAGLGLMGLAIGEMARARTTVVPRREAEALVTTGIFARSRNPIYLGDALVLSGAALILDAPLGLLLVPLFVWIVTHRFIRGEEAMLSAKFPAEFGAYTERTRRWL